MCSTLLRFENHLRTRETTRISWYFTYSWKLEGCRTDPTSLTLVNLKGRTDPTSLTLVNLKGRTDLSSLTLVNLKGIGRILLLLLLET